MAVRWGGLEPHQLGDGVAVNVVGAAADRADAHVAEQPLDLVRHRVARAAHDLHGEVGAAELAVGALDLGDRRLLDRVEASIEHVGQPVGQRLRGAQQHAHVGELVLDRLEARDRLAELDALLRERLGVLDREMHVEIGRAHV